MTAIILTRIVAVNSRFAAFFGKSEEWLRGNDFARLESETLSLSREISEIGRSLGRVAPEGLDSESKEQVSLYRENLRRFGEFLSLLQIRAGERRRELQGEARGIEASIEWCRAMKFTVPD